MEQLVNLVSRSTFARLLLAGIIVAMPVGLSTAWLGSANWVLISSNVDFASLFPRVFLSSQIGPILGYILFFYPCERWIIGNRALHSRQWVFVRFIVYLVLAVPMGWLTLVAIRLGAQKFPDTIESSYFVITVANIGIVALMYSFIEQFIAEITRRETILKKQIAAMSIEIDQARCNQQVGEITGTDYFRDLQAKASKLRSNPPESPTQK